MIRTVVGLWGLWGVVAGVASEKPTSFCFGKNDTLAVPDGEEVRWGDVLGGDWYQVLSSRYVTTTDLIDQNCVRNQVVVGRDPFLVMITRKAIQHRNPLLVSSDVFNLTHPRHTTPYWEFPHAHTKTSFYLRCAERHDPSQTSPGDILIWTSSDNLTMTVWSRDHAYFTTYQRNDVLHYLTEIEYVGPYKTPVDTFTENICT